MSADPASLSATKLMLYLAVGSFAASQFSDEIRSIINYIVSTASELAIIKMSVDQTNAQSIYSLHQHLIDSEKVTTTINVNDGVGNIRVSPGYGNYYLYDDNCGPIIISLSEDSITVRALNVITNAVSITNWFNNLMSKYCSPSVRMRYYTIQHKVDYGYNWRYLTSRSLINMNTIPNKSSINKFKQSVQKFIGSKRKYHDKGMPYRYGYLLHGPKGSHKTLMAKYVATKYHRPIYNLNLRDNNMSDVGIENLMANVPSNSIIILDELDIMVEGMLNDTAGKLTTAGILKALGGVIELDDGIIVIITTNNFGKLNNMLPALCRKGRVDEIIEFKL